jgi:thioredoxin 1
MKVIALDDTNFNNMMEKGSMIALFWADWCPLCIILLETFKVLAEKYSDKFNFVTINIDENQEISLLYNIIGVPTVIAYSDGEIIDVRPGFRETDEYIDMIGHLTIKKTNQL